MLSKTISIISPHQYQISRGDIWQSYSNGRHIQLNGRVNSISICPSPPYKYCIPNGYKIYLYRCDGDRLYRKLGGFGTRVSCCQFRGDGKLVIVGEENGVIRMCTTDKNAFHLRKINAHKGSVTAAAFFVDGHTAASIGADSMVRLWDVSLGTEKQKFRLGSGSEPAKALVVGRQDHNLMCCGNLEGCVSIYDIRERNPVHMFQVPSAVSALAVNKDDGRIVVADGPSIRVWDHRQRTFLCQSFSPNDSANRSPNSLRLHYKTVTALWVTDNPDSSASEVLLSASTDKLVKMTHLADWQELHQIRCPRPLTAVGATPNCDTIVIGGEKGFVKVQHMRTDMKNLMDTSIETLRSNISKEELENATGLDPSILHLAAEFSGRWKGGNRFVAMTTDDWLSHPFDGPRLGPRHWLSNGNVKKAGQTLPLIHETSEISRDQEFYSMDSAETLTEVDHLLLRFTHSEALTAVTRHRIRAKKGKRIMFMHPLTALRLAIGVIRELIRRGTLSTAVAGRISLRLAPLLRFIRRNVWRKEAAATCLALYNYVYTEKELNSVPEFPKVNDVLRTLSQNTQALAAVIEFLHSLSSSPSSTTIESTKETNARRNELTGDEPHSQKHTPTKSKPILSSKKSILSPEIALDNACLQTSVTTSEQEAKRPKLL
ncbi:U3 small nucleolar RNA-associated protein 15 [Fasciola hepatica]|uniref:U3 small nucleolar RNA-associated protein 15 homolog n=1 Tax=Fasciola hepatica TaxID=6192 RepID=A0A4E0S0M1_FASHE|nr:U3 small nucleolar RNA-associated protein 15 [Fasciola hepatica]